MSEWNPTRCLQFLGLLVNAEAFTFAVPDGKIAKIHSHVNALLERFTRGERIPAKQIATVCGHILSCRLAVAPARIYTRAMYTVLNQAEHWNQSLHLSGAAVDELRFWSDHLRDYSEQGMIPAVYTTRLHCDASDDGWGAHCHTASAHGKFLTTDCAASSTHRELLGLLYAIRTPILADAIRGHRVVFTLDSSAAVYNLMKGGGPKENLSNLVKDIWRECVRLNVDASVEWTSRNNNEYADYLSKFRDSADWRLAPRLFAELDARFGPHTIDRFAASHNTHCDRFNSRYYDPGAEQYDAFKQDWSADNNFCNPDFNDIGRVLALARQQRACATIIFPDWKSQPWHPTILAAASAVVTLGKCYDALIPGPRGEYSVLTFPDWTVCAARVDFRAQTSIANS